jgi:hypothetical protein
MVNLATNFGSICLFMLKGKIICDCLPMAASNAFGGWLGQTGHYERKRLYPNIFLVVVVATLARFVYDVFFLKSVFGTN